MIRLSITETRVEVIDAQIHIWEENRPGRPWQVDFAHTRGVSLQVDLMNPNPTETLRRHMDQTRLVAIRTFLGMTG